MSGSIYPALQVQVPDPAKPQGEWADVAGRQAQTALLGQQTQGAAIQNRQNALMLGYRANLLGLDGGQGGGQPVDMLGGMMPQGGGDMSGGQGGGGGVQSPIGVPLPRMLYASAALSQNPDQAFKAAADIRRQRLFELASQSTPETWSNAVMTAYQEGWITQQAALQAAKNPGMRTQFLQSLATPEANLNLQRNAIAQGIVPDGRGGWTPEPSIPAAKGAISGAEAGAKADFEPIDVTVPDGGKDAQGNPTYRVQQMTRKQFSGMAQGNGARETSAADYANPAITIGPESYADRVIQRESGGAAGATNARSTAGGGGQFIDGTWLEQVKRQRPDLAQGKSDAEILALRTDPTLTKEITGGYGKQNAAALAQAGLPVNAMTLGLAHQFGPDGAKGVLSAPQNAKIESAPGVTDAVLKANPDLRGKTIGSVVADAYRAYGVNPVGFTGGQQVAGRPATGQPASVQPASAQLPQPPLPGVGGAPVLTPGQKIDQEADLAQRKDDITQMGESRKALVADSSAATQMNHVIDTMRQDSQSWQPGKFADVKMNALSYMDSLGQTFGWKPDKSVADWQQFNKNAMELVRQAVRATSARAAAQEFNMIAKSLPTDTTSPQALNQIFDELQGINDWKTAKAAASAVYKGNPAQFEKDWNNNVSVGVYVLNRMNAADATALAKSLNKTPEGRKQWQDWMGQAKLLHEGNVLAQR